MRLPRSIAPTQWIEFLESHLTLFLATLEAQGINIRTSVNLEEAPRSDVSERTRLVTALMDEIGEAMSKVRPENIGATTRDLPNAGPMQLEDVFEAIDSGALNEAEKTLRGLDSDAFPSEQLSEVWSHLGLAFQNNHESKRAMVAYQHARELNPETCKPGSTAA